MPTSRVYDKLRDEWVDLTYEAGPLYDKRFDIWRTLPLSPGDVYDKRFDTHVSIPPGEHYSPRFDRYTTLETIDELLGEPLAPAIMQATTFTGGSTLESDGSALIPGTAGWKGVSGPAAARVNGLAMLVRWQPDDVQAGTPGLANAPYAAGFFPSAAPADPLAAGHALTISNNDAFAGRLGALGVAHGQVLRSIKQVEHDLVAIAGTTGGVLYGAALVGARGYGDRPNMRPLAVDRSRTDATLYAGAYSRGAGVRVEEFQTAVLPEYPNSYGTPGTS